jgi:hypothetical protein
MGEAQRCAFGCSFGLAREAALEALRQTGSALRACGKPLGRWQQGMEVLLPSVETLG